MAEQGRVGLGVGGCIEVVGFDFDSESMSFLPICVREDVSVGVVWFRRIDIVIQYII